MKTLTDIWKLRLSLVQRQIFYIREFDERVIFSIALAPTATWHVRRDIRHTRYETYDIISGYGTY